MLYKQWQYCDNNKLNILDCSDIYSKREMYDYAGGFSQKYLQKQMVSLHCPTPYGSLEQSWMHFCISHLLESISLWHVCSGILTALAAWTAKPVVNSAVHKRKEQKIQCWMYVDVNIMALVWAIPVLVCNLSTHNNDTFIRIIKMGPYS